MNRLPMTDSHQTSAPWAWRLAPRQAITLAAEAADRWLLVNDGQVWLTQTDRGELADDIWLNAGESLRLPAGSTWVQAWPQASLSLIQQAPAAVVSDRRASTAFWPSWRPTAAQSAAQSAAHAA